MTDNIHLLDTLSKQAVEAHQRVLANIQQLSEFLTRDVADEEIEGASLRNAIRGQIGAVSKEIERFDINANAQLGIAQMYGTALVNAAPDRVSVDPALDE